MTPKLAVTRAQILAFRRAAGGLDERMPPGRRSLRLAAWAGLQDSMPRAALLSIHARIRRTSPATVEDPSLVQIWGPRFSAYVVSARDIAPFTLGRFLDDARARRVAEDLATRLRDLLADGSMDYERAGRALGEHPNRLRYATTTGTVLIDWDGARRPTIRSVAPPDVDPADARLELARRYLHVFGPATPGGFATWAGLGAREASAAFARLAGSLVPARTPIGEGWILGRDEERMRAARGLSGPSPARLLPSGDAFFLLQGRDRELLVPDARRRGELWTSRVWPGAVLAGGEVVGTWRRAGETVSVQTWRRLSRATRDAVEAEALGLPLPGLKRAIRVRWSS
jgi:hypothetical protein